MSTSWKIDKKIVLPALVIYLVLFSGIFVFYLLNPFNNKCLQGNCWDGYGTYRYHSGMKYEGEWKYGLRHGNGKLTLPDLYVYDGQWRFNQRDGHGTIVYRKGSHHIAMYEGSWKGGNREGEGTMVYQNGARYIGIWKNGIRSGKGTLVSRPGIIFEGQWESDTLRGNIIITGFDGDRYKAELSGNNNIQGSVTFPDGRKFRAPWIGDQLVLGANH